MPSPATSAAAPAAVFAATAAAVAFLPPAASPRWAARPPAAAAPPPSRCRRPRRLAGGGGRHRHPPTVAAMGPPPAPDAAAGHPARPSATASPPTAATAATTTATAAAVPVAAAAADTPPLPLPPSPPTRGTPPPLAVPHPVAPAGVTFRVAATAADVAAARALRVAVFVDEMGIDVAAELDEHDVLDSPTTVHVLAVRAAASGCGDGDGGNGDSTGGGGGGGGGETVVGACRVRAAAGTVVKVERVVVAAAARRGGTASAMLAYAAGRVGVDRRLPAGSAVALHAMAHLAGLYSRLGWVTVSGVFDEEHIPHVRMVHWGGDPTAGTPNLLAPPPPPPPSPRTEGDATPAANPAPGPAPVVASSSHVCLAVADVEASCAYFGLWGFVEDRRFLTGGRRAMWLRAAWPALGGEVLELVEDRAAAAAVPAGAAGGRPHSPPPTGGSPTGVRHLCLDVTRLCTDLAEYLAGVAARSAVTYGRRLDVVTPPVQVLMGDLVAQVAVVRHGGVEMELLRRQAVLPPGKAPAPDW